MKGWFTKKQTEDVLDLFKYRIKTKIVIDKEAHLLHELLKGIKYLSGTLDNETPVVWHTSSLKQN